MHPHIWTSVGADVKRGDIAAEFDSTVTCGLTLPVTVQWPLVELLPAVTEDRISCCAGFRQWSGGAWCVTGQSVLWRPPTPAHTGGLASWLTATVRLVVVQSYYQQGTFWCMWAFLPLRVFPIHHFDFAFTFLHLSNPSSLCW
jgi:hypothetical protein